MKSFLLVLVLCTTGYFAVAQSHGTVSEHEVIKSNILHKDVAYAVYLPFDYTTSNRNYPVVYLLHGYTDDQTGWLQFGEINRYADNAIAHGIIPPMIIIMPNADSSWYINSFDGNENYEDFFIKELMPTVEKKYRIKAEKKFRGIAGLSMGGYGTLIYAMKYPDLFAAAAPLSAAVFTDDEMVNMPQKSWDITFARLYGNNLTGKQRLNNAWYQNSILKMVENTPADSLKKVRYWIDCGDDDFLTRGNCMLHIALTDKKIPHEYRVRDGAHNWTYWRTGITDALQFIGNSFHQF
ncbi:MAG: esterase family protein [Hydrotalea flava]|uniref:alpha/beta hydrolase n=1 Tax=Hydrotalea TaxID=1004300 RepID=UPI000943B959|nr:MULTISPECIES: alpha/beta hydrolase-fold protein [Hydrotalea]MBY0348944.1 esterase family protein [Hydrotalea flava]RWZ86412.1 MAG: esterase family protein [Hydrotalea sp. AMD]